MKNKRAIILGGDHHNTLAIVRCLAKRKVDILIGIHTSVSNLEEVSLAKSKYAKNRIEVLKEEEEEIIKFLKRNVIKEKKQVIFPCSDFSEYILDKYFKELSEYYILPGFRKNPGRVIFYMNKENQKKFSEINHILMAKTWVIKIENNKFIKPFDLVFPCIIKPKMSAFGNKSDITIVKTEKEIDNALEEVKKKGYEEVLIQEFIKKDYEVCAFGTILEKQPYFAGGVVKKLNEYPPQGGGSLTFAKFIKDPNINEILEKIRKILYMDGYRGMYDIEFLVCSDKIYLNEINFRHSGNGYALIKNGIEIPYYYYLDATDQNDLLLNKKYEMNKETYHMDELLEITLLSKGGISLFKFISSVIKTKAFAKWDIFDLKGTFAYYKKVICLIFYKLKKIGGIVGK